MTKQSSAVKKILAEVRKNLKADSDAQKTKPQEPDTTCALAKSIILPPDREEYYTLKSERRSRLRGNFIMQQNKRDKHNIFNELLRQGGYKRPQKYKNPISEIIESVKKDYKNKTGQDLKLANGTLENWVYDFFNCHGN